MTQVSTNATPPRRGKVSEAELQRLEAIIACGKRVKSIQRELKEHDAKRDRFRNSIVQRLEAEEKRLKELTSTVSIEQAAIAIGQAVAS